MTGNACAARSVREQNSRPKEHFRAAQVAPSCNRGAVRDSPARPFPRVRGASQRAVDSHERDGLRSGPPSSERALGSPRTLVAPTRVVSSGARADISSPRRASSQGGFISSRRRATPALRGETKVEDSASSEPVRSFSRHRDPSNGLVPRQPRGRSALSTTRMAAARPSARDSPTAKRAPGAAPPRVATNRIRRCAPGTCPRRR